MSLAAPNPGVDQARARLQRRYLQASLALGLVLATGKFVAWYVTGSSSLMADALESVVNISAAGFALYMSNLASKPRDANHPYGHGKFEFLSSGFEGGLIFMAGIGILYQAYHALRFGIVLQQLGVGIAIGAVAAIGNGLMGWALVRAGRKYRSQVLEADGKHLLSDTVSSIGMLLALGLIMLTGFEWIDPLVAILLGLWIMYHGVQLMRKALGGLVDEADTKLLATIARIMQANRQPTWVDLHNLRIQRYGGDLHIDAHLTLPWYYQLKQVHHELQQVHVLLDNELPHGVELFIHADPCMPFSCPLCQVPNCPERQAGFEQQLPWTATSIATNAKHGKPDPN